MAALVQVTTVGDDARILECVECGEKYSEDDVFNLNYFPQTRVCFKCYQNKQRAPFTTTCFGKRSKGKQYGYDPMAIECRQQCPDRKICQQFVSKDMERRRELTEAQRKVALRLLLYKPRPKSTVGKPFKRGSTINTAFRMCVRGTTRAKLQALVERRGGDITHVLRILRRESIHGYQWEWKESSGNIHIVFHED